VGMKIILTGDDAREYLAWVQPTQRERSAKRLFEHLADEQIQTGSTAELQKEIDAHWAAKGVRSEEILTSPEDAARILAEMGAPVPVTLVGADPTGETDCTAAFQAAVDALPQNASVELDTAALFGGQPPGNHEERFPVTAVVTDNAVGQALAQKLQAAGVPTVTAPPGPPAIVAIAPTLDKDGFPWDQRIHSGSKAINKDGTWRTKKNLDPATLAVVTAELKQLMGIPSPVASTNIPQPPTNAAPAPFQPPVGPAAVVGDAAAAFAAKQIPLIPPVPAVPFAPAVPVPPPSGAAPITSSVQENSAVLPLPPTTAITASLSNTPPTLSFGELIFKVSQGVAQGTLTDARVTEVCAKHGLPGGQIVLIGSRPDLIPQVAKDLGLM